MSDGLVEEIQRGAMDPAVKVSTLLRQVKLAAGKLKLDFVPDWVDAELRGYPNATDLPEYRKLPGRAMVQTIYHGWQPLLLEKKLDFLATATIGNSIGNIESFLANEDNETLLKPYPAEVVKSLSEHNGRQIMQAGCFIHRSACAAVLDAVRDLVFDWAIELERAGVTGGGISFTPNGQQQTRDTIINVGYINEMTGNLGVGITSGDIVSAPLDIDGVRNLVLQIKSNSSGLTNDGVDGAALAKVVETIEKHIATGNQTLLRHALAELEKVVIKASGSLLAQGVLALLHQVLGTGIPAG